MIKKTLDIFLNARGKTKIRNQSVSKKFSTKVNKKTFFHPFLKTNYFF